MDVRFEARYSDDGVFALNSHVIILCDSRQICLASLIFPHVRGEYVSYRD